MKVTKRHYAAALTLANKARKKLGKKPVTRLRKGVQSESASCPVARTIGSDVGVDYPGAGSYYIGTVYTDSFCDEVLVTGGKLAGEFLSAFDKGDIPELIAS